MFIIYDLLFFVGFILYLPVLFVRGKLHKGFRFRLGMWGPETDAVLSYAGSTIWVHAVSVGEVLAIIPVVERLKEKYRNDRFVITVTTPTGHDLAKKKFPKDTVIFSPLDLSWVVSRFIRTIRPKIYIAAETELWPSLFRRLHKCNIPVIVVNGRISDKSFENYRRIKWFLKPLIKSVYFCMQSAVDVQRIESLGATPYRVKIAGNLKFENLPQVSNFSNGDYGFPPEDELWIAGSTHPGEEEIVLNVFKGLKKDFPKLRLVLAPRHVDRANDVEQIVAHSGLKPVKFSALPSSTLEADSVVVIDSIGHLRSLYALASVVFVGKSLIGKGGQNLIEPAFFGKPVIVGPFMDNFRDVMGLFMEGNALVRVHNPVQLGEALRKILSDPAYARQLGEAARQVIEQNRGATEKTMEVVGRILK